MGILQLLHFEQMVERIELLLLKYTTFGETKTLKELG